MSLISDSNMTREEASVSRVIQGLIFSYNFKFMLSSLLNVLPTKNRFEIIYDTPCYAKIKKGNVMTCSKPKKVGSAV